MTFRFGRKVAAAFAVTAFLTGCASSERLNNIHVGMTKQEVIQALGNPTSVNAQGGAEFLIYNLYAGITATAWNQNYYVQLVQGRVVSYGQPPSAPAAASVSLTCSRVGNLSVCE